LDFLAGHTQVYLLARTSDGAPIGYPMVGRLNDDGVEFSTYRKSAKVANVLRSDQASCLVVPRDGSADRRTLWVCGPVSIRDDDVASGVFERGPGTTETGLGVPQSIKDKVKARHGSGKRCVLRIDIEQFRFAELPATDGRQA
jgi:hypothetical protein